jgi:hypothetical protein
MSTTNPPVDAVSDDRKAFETWFASMHGTLPLTWVEAEGGPYNVPNGMQDHYFIRSTQQAWEAWQAAILALRTPAPLDWTKIEAAIHAYVEDYEMLGEDDSGRDGCYSPTETERGLITDAIMGLLADDDFMAALRTPAQGEPVAAGCGEYGHEQGICGNAQCCPSARATAQVLARQFSQIEDACDKAEAPIRSDDGHWYTLPERVQFLAATAQADLQALRADEGTRLLGELLAHMHRDGGHHHAAVGTEQAVKDAIKNWHGIRVENDALRADAVTDVAAERERQKTREGWTAEHDDEHTDGSIAVAAGCYAIHAGIAASIDSGQIDFYAKQQLHKIVPDYWPWDRKWWKPKDQRRNLVRAGALILAEIERLDRAAIDAAKKEQGS